MIMPLTDYFEFMDEVDHRQLNAFYNTLDLFVLPSYWDAFGCVIQRHTLVVCLLWQLKVLVLQNIYEKHDFDNWVIEPHDYKSLAQNICRYMNHREKQTLKYSVDINELIKPFINYLMSR